MSNPADQTTSFERDATATVAVTAYSLVVAAGFARVFSGWQFLVDLALLVVVGHATSLLMRRLKVSGWIAVPFVTLVLMWLLLALHYGETMTWMVPQSSTFDLVGLEVGLVRDQFQTAVAPVVYGAGWATLAGFAVIIAVVMSDAFAFRAEARAEALVPGGVLFIFISALGSSRLRVGITAALVAAGVIAVVALRAFHDRSRRVELATSRGRSAMVAPAAIATAVVIAVLAGLIGPRVPGANAEPIYETRGRNGGVTEVDNPLVDIRSQLTNRGNVELFRVNADVESYWRKTTLPEFDGQTFGQPTRPLEDADGTFGESIAGSVPIFQQIQILALDGVFVPAAADPQRAGGFSNGGLNDQTANGPTENNQIELRLISDSNTLVTPDKLQPGDLFTVESSSLRLTPEQLRGATSDSPPDEIFLGLPDDLPDLVAETAELITADAPTPYDKAVALQNWFRSEFTYSIEVQQGHGSSAIEIFLNDRIGYCEQFAATFAAMTRTLDIPSRVAVGYTPGTLNADGWYSVIGKNSHAWPEVWFDEIGWVAFEPTPGRGAPGDTSYTGLQPDQDTSGPEAPGNGATDPSQRPTTPSTVVRPPGDPDAATPTTTQPRRPGDLGTGGSERNRKTGGGSSFPRVATGLLLLCGVALGSPAIGRRWRSRRLRRDAPERRIHRAWNRATVSAQRAGVDGRPSMTAWEWASATASHLPVAARPMRSLAEIVDRVTFARPGLVDLEHAGTFGKSLTDECVLWADQVARISHDTQNNRQRIRAYFTDWG